MPLNAISAALETENGPVLVRSLEQLLTRLVRLLVGRISLVRLLELIRNIYIREVVEYLEREAPDKRITKAQLALMTGIDTRTLAKQMESRAFDRPMHENAGFLAAMTPETRIISTWMSEPRFLDQSTQSPLPLSLEPGPRSFHALVARAIGGRGLTIASVLQRLQLGGAVAVDETAQEVRLVADTYYPFLNNDDTAMLDVGLSTAATLLRTVSMNMERAANGEEKLFQRSSFTHQLDPQNQAEFQHRMKAFLTGSESECKSLIADMEGKMPVPGQITAGVSFFYFEEPSSQHAVVK